jgi:hypothetical protein
MASKQKLGVEDLYTEKRTPPPDMGSFTSGLDGRMRQVEIQIILGQKQTWTYSLDSKNMECRGCQQHNNMVAFPRRTGGGCRAGRQVIWLADQATPPILPSPSKSWCVKIIRLENGILSEMAEGLVKLLAGRQVAGGSAVLLASGTNMAVAGTAGYAADLVNAIKYLRSSLGDHLHYGPLPTLFINGCNDAATLATCFEINAWARRYFRNCDALLHNSIVLVEGQLRARGDRTLLPNLMGRIRLPSSQRDAAAVMTYVTGGEPLPDKVRPPTAAEEKEAVVAIIEELWQALAVDLDQNPIVDRWPTIAAAAGEAQKSFLLVGSSHVGKLGAALQRLGHMVDCVYEPHWKVFKNSAATMAEKVINKLSEVRADYVIFRFLDNSMFML